MAFTSILQVLKVNELRKGTSTKTGRPYEMQDCECALLSDAGELEQVGVLPLGKDMMGDNAPKVGTYTASFALRAGMQDRKIGAVLTGLTPYDVRKPGAPVVPAAAPKAGA